MKIIPNFPDLRQIYDYDCGANSIMSILIYYGIDTRQEFIMEKAMTTNDGTTPENMVKVLKSYGFNVKSGSLNIKQLKRFIDNDMPVIVLIQAWTEDEEVDWENDWHDGHYVVAIGYDDDKIIFEDPSSITRVYVPIDEFKKRWHDAIIQPNYKKVYKNYAIVPYGKNKIERKLEYMS